MCNISSWEVCCLCCSSIECKQHILFNISVFNTAHLHRECINSGLDYWNGGMVDWIFLFGFLIIYDLYINPSCTIVH